MVERYHKGPNWKADEAELDRKAWRTIKLFVSLCLILMAICVLLLLKEYGKISW